MVVEKSMSVKIFGTHDANTIEQINQVAQRTEATALMADGHKGYVMPIGGVAAYDNQVSVVGVGYDIACGNCAIRTDLKLSDIGKTDSRLDFRLNQFANQINNKISFGLKRPVNRADDAPTDHELFSDAAWEGFPKAAKVDELKEKARNQLGTVGSGNHYVDVFADENSDIWVGVHFGSRGLGHNIASGFIAMDMGGHWGDRVNEEREVIFHLNSWEGQAYWELMTLAGKYAYAGREWVARKVVREILKANELEMVHNHHNFAWKETHYKPGTWDKREYVVVRKGATPAFPGQKGFVGGSMGDSAVILEGNTDNYAKSSSEGLHIENEQRDALYSTVHGAGRVMSRTEAAGKRDRKTGKLRLNKETGEVLKPGKISQEMMNSWLEKEKVVLRGGGLDESPHVYRRLPDVLKEQGNTIKVLHTLKPLIVVMAGSDVFDPFKD